MLLGDFNSIYIGDTPINAVYIGSDLVWSAEKGGLDPYGRNWNLYGVQPCEYNYLNPGILLKGLSSEGSFMFTCAESPEKIDFTTIKSVQVNYTGYAGDAGTSGGVAVIPITHSTNPKSQIIYTALALADAESTTVTLNCEAVGGQQFLLLYSDLDYTMEITELVIEHYAEDAIIDLTSSTWEQRNFQYESDTVITCANDIQIPVGASGIAIHISTYDSGGLKSCLAFLDENKNIISYGDNWQGTNPTDVTVSTHFQSIPSNAAYFQIAVGRAPDMTSLITPQDLKECIVCFSIDNIYMPIMDGITNYYDCKRDVTIGGYWKSQVKFYEKSYDMPLGGNISIADDGAITMTGDSSGYAWFYSATADYTTRSAYVIAKADASTIHSQNPVLLGVSSAGGDKNTVSISTQRNTNVLDLDLWGANVESIVNSSDYHVCVWTRNGSINSFYVDGVLIGTLDVSNKYYVTYSTYQGCEEQLWGVGCLFRGNSYNSWGDKVQKYFKFIAIADTAHTSEQIAENTAWLKKYYSIE